ncbi:unnamed protein product [Mucor hiemalis]
MDIIGHFYDEEDDKDKDFFSDFFYEGSGSSHITCEQSKPPFRVRMDTKVYVIKKGTPLMSMAFGGEEISTYFTMHNYVEDLQICISLHTEEQDEYGVEESETRTLKLFYINRTHPSYPIIFKTKVSQTGSINSGLNMAKMKEQNHLALAKTFY